MEWVDFELSITSLLGEVDGDYGITYYSADDGLDNRFHVYYDCFINRFLLCCERDLCFVHLFLSLDFFSTRLNVSLETDKQKRTATSFVKKDDATYRERWPFNPSNVQRTSGQLVDRS